MEVAPNSDKEAKQDQKDDLHAKSISAMKASAKSKYQQREDTVDSVALPQPTFREVPADVNANHVRSARAEPAPRSQPPAPPGMAWKKQKSKKPGDTGGSDGDSGSDSDEGGRRKRGVGSPSQPSRRPKPQSLRDSVAQASRDASLSAEEEERLQLRRVLNNFEDTWGDRLRYRSQKRVEGEQRRRRLAQSKEQTRPNSELLDQVRKQDKALEDYLDESLLSDIAEDRFKDADNPNASLEVMTSLILKAEQIVFQVLLNRNCNRNNPIKAASGFPIDIDPVEFMCEEITHLRVGCDDRFHGNPTKRSILQWILFDTVPSDSIYRSIAYAYIEEMAEELVNDIRSPSQEPLPFITTMQGSRARHYLNPRLNLDYIKWVWSRCDPAALKEVLSGDDGYKRQCRKERIDKYRESMSAVHVSQEFVMINDFTIGMALLKNGRVSTFREVSSEDLGRMGWRRDAEAKGDYWRYQIFSDTPDLVFFVNMEGEVLGLADSEVDGMIEDGE